MEGAEGANPGVVTDLSTTGLYFRTSAGLAVGTRVRAVLWTGAADIVGVEILIVRKEQLAEDFYGYGAEITAMTEEHRQQLGACLTELRRRELGRDWARK
jgi:hypothetical protein